MTEPTNAPAPSNHVFLHELPNLEPGSKVRFLCCVLDYDIETGSLLVEHAYPIDREPPPRARVGIDIVLETINRDMLSPGAWLNIIGFYRGVSEDELETGHLPFAHALIVWDAGVFNIQDYETTMQASIARLRAAKASIT